MLCRNEHSFHVCVGSLDFLDNSKHLRDVIRLERKVLVVVEDVFSSQIGWSFILLLAGLIDGKLILLDLIVVSKGLLDRVAEDEFALAFIVELDSNTLANVSQKGCLVVDS